MCVSMMALVLYSNWTIPLLVLMISIPFFADIIGAVNVVAVCFTDVAACVFAVVPSRLGCLWFGAVIEAGFGYRNKTNMFVERSYLFHRLVI